MASVSTADNVIVRRENSEEHGQIRLVNEAAFGRPDEADLVDSLRNEGVVLASVVAELDTRVVGHILFSRMSIETAIDRVPAVALAPVAVALTTVAVALTTVATALTTVATGMSSDRRGRT